MYPASIERVDYIDSAMVSLASETSRVFHHTVAVLSAFRLVGLDHIAASYPHLPRTPNRSGSARDNH